MVGSDTLKNLTQQVLNGCTALQAKGNPIVYDGTGSGPGENALKIIGALQTQQIAPMSRPMAAAICTGGPTVAQRAGAEGMVIALDGLAIIGNASNVGPEGIDYPGTAGVSTNEWRTVLRLIYTGMDIAAGNNLFLRNCDSDARKAIVNNWDNVFHGTVTSCTDSHPSVPGTGANAYDASNSIIEPGVRHAFRRDDESGTTDVFLGQLGLSGVDFAAAAPSGANAVQTAVYRALARSPFCNNKRPDDDWQPVTLPANATLGFFSSQIPEMTNVGLPASAGPGLGYATQAKGSANAKNMGPFFNEYSDQDPIRRQCVGRGSNAAPNLPMEQVCGPDGKLGVVLPIAIPPELSAAEMYPSLPCEPGKGFKYGPGLLRPDGTPVRCPNGDVAQDSKCLLPVRTQGTGLAFDCINPPGNVPGATIDHSGDPTKFTDAPLTDGRTDVDGRVYNLVLRQADGTIRLVNRPDPSRLGVISTPVAGAFYRIHTTRSLLLPPAHTTNLCATNNDATDQIGCLTLASPCSIGYAGNGAVTTNPGTTAALVNGIQLNKTTVQALVLGGTTYPIARKLYVNTLQGFDILHNSDTVTYPDFDSEEELAKCFATLPFTTINVENPSIGFFKLPPSPGQTQEKPLCEDFNNLLCTADTTTNEDGCVGNENIAGGIIPTSLCDNGLKDGDETGPDVCPTVRPTCNTTTHHCQ
jgi:ABC-type phosphate transport system substrate-binding protein